MENCCQCQPHIVRRTSPRNFEKFETSLLGYLEVCGKLIHEKNLKSKISWHSPFKPYSVKCPLSHQIAAKLLTHSSAAEEKVWSRGNYWFLQLLYHKMWHILFISPSVTESATIWVKKMPSNGKNQRTNLTIWSEIHPQTSFCSSNLF